MLVFLLDFGYSEIFVFCNFGAILVLKSNIINNSSFSALLTFNNSEMPYCSQVFFLSYCSLINCSSNAQLSSNNLSYKDLMLTDRAAIARLRFHVNSRKS